MGFIQSIRSAFERYFVFSGRSSRSEFWYFTLFMAVGVIVTIALDAVLWKSVGIPVLGGIFFLVTYIASISLTVRRLHDIGRSGWWWWLSWASNASGSVANRLEGSGDTSAAMPLEVVALYVVGAVCTVVFLYWMCKKGNESENRFGQNPLSARRPPASGPDESFASAAPGD